MAFDYSKWITVTPKNSDTQIPLTKVKFHPAKSGYTPDTEGDVWVTGEIDNTESAWGPTVEFDNTKAFTSSWTEASAEQIIEDIKAYKQQMQKDVYFGAVYGGGPTSMPIVGVDDIIEKYGYTGTYTGTYGAVDIETSGTWQGPDPKISWTDEINDIAPIGIEEDDVYDEPPMTEDGLYMVGGKALTREQYEQVTNPSHKILPDDKVTEFISKYVHPSTITYSTSMPASTSTTYTWKTSMVLGPTDITSDDQCIEEPVDYEIDYAVVEPQKTVHTGHSTPLYPAVGDIWVNQLTGSQWTFKGWDKGGWTSPDGDTLTTPMVKVQQAKKKAKQHAIDAWKAKFAQKVAEGTETDWLEGTEAKVEAGIEKVLAITKGCCTACEGTGYTYDPSTGGKCWDCMGTGHTHHEGDCEPKAEGGEIPPDVLAKAKKWGWLSGEPKGMPPMGTSIDESIAAAADAAAEDDDEDPGFEEYGPYDFDDEQY